MPTKVLKRSAAQKSKKTTQVIRQTAKVAKVKVQGLYAHLKGKNIPEPRLPRCKPAGGAACFKALAWNVGGLRAVIANRGKELQRLAKEEKPALIGIMETKLQEGESVEAATQALKELLPDYEAAAFSCSKVKKGYSGTAVLLRKDVVKDAKATPVKLEKGADEGRSIVVELPKFFVVVCYVPNAGEGLVRLKERIGHWDPKLREYLSSLARRKPVILLSDCNAAHRDEDIWNAEAPHVPKQPSCTAEERASFGKLLEAGFVDTFAHQHPKARGAFTYWSVRGGGRRPNRGLRLDYALASSSLMVKKGGPRIVDAFHLPGFAPKGDHCPVGVTIQLA